jgi:putative tryptophan/tyrosine transport system substrate-binding protein
MRRRDALILLSCAAASTLPARAEQMKTIVGFLHSASPRQYGGVIDAFRRGLNETGIIETQNLAIEQRWAENQVDGLPALAAGLVNLDDHQGNPKQLPMTPAVWIFLPRAF